MKSAYPFLQHEANASLADPVVTHVEGEFKLEGYARLFKLKEAITLQVESLDRPPSAIHPKRKWCEILMGKQKNVDRFLESLEEIGEIRCEVIGNKVRIEMPNLLKSLESRRGSRTSKAMELPPREEEEHIQGEGNLDKEDVAVESSTSSSDSTDLLWEKVSELLSSKDNDLPEQFYKLVGNYFFKHGADKKVLEKLVRKISDRFSSSEKAKSYGEDIITQIKRGHKIGCNEFNDRQVKKRKEKREELRKAVRHIPAIQEVREAIRRGEYAEVTIGEYDQAVQLLFKHFEGDEEFVREQFSGLLEARSKLEERLATPKITRKQRVEDAVEINDPHRDDDD